MGCNKINVRNNLPALQFHHKFEMGKRINKLKWIKICHLRVNEIKNRLKDGKCLCLCANCHKMAHSHQFEKLHQEIGIPTYSKDIDGFYDKLRKNIYKFKIK